MPLWLVTGLMISVVAIILKAPLRYALVAFLAVVILLPAGMVFPNGLSPLPTIALYDGPARFSPLSPRARKESIAQTPNTAGTPTAPHPNK